MLTSIRNFLVAKDGATTVDFVIGAAAGILLAVTITQLVSDGSLQMSENMSDELESMSVATGM